MTSPILIIEDDKEIGLYLKEILVGQGYSVRLTTSGSKAMTLLEEFTPDLILLDLLLPDIKGESLCQQIREHFGGIPIIMLTSKSSVTEKVQGLQSGADDYITKPFAVDELLARVAARLRTFHPEEAKLEIADLVMDRKKVEVFRGGRQIHLTPQEFKLLEYLILNKTAVLSREMILNRIWSYSLDVESRVVDVYMGYLRKKIDNGHKKKLIHSVRGFGYMIKE